jgi:neuropeptide Y receptor type 1
MCYPPWENGYQDLFFWLSGVLLVVVGILGIVGNLLNLIVLCKSPLRSQVFYNLLAWLALFDIIFIASHGSRVGYESLACQPADSLLGYIAACILDVGLIGSVLTTVAVSAERYLGICHPHLSFTRRTSTYIVPVICFTFAILTPRFLKVSFTIDNNGSVVGHMNDWAKEDTFKLGYYLMTFVVGNIIPTLMLAFFNCAILRKIHSTSKIMSTEQKNLQEKKNTSKILFSIVFLFFVCNTPWAIKVAFYIPKSHPEWLLALAPVYKFSLVLNSSINFVIYCLVGKKFRKCFLDTLCSMQTEDKTTLGVSLHSVQPIQQP